MLEYDVGVGLPERRKPRTPTGTENRRDAVELLLLAALLSDAAPPRNRDDTGDPESMFCKCGIPEEMLPASVSTISVFVPNSRLRNLI